MVESNGDGESTFGARAVASDPAASFVKSTPVVEYAAQLELVPTLTSLPSCARPANAKLFGVTLLMIQVPSMGGPLVLVTLLIVTAAPLTSPTVPVAMIVTGTLPEVSVLMTRVIVPVAVELLSGGW